MNWTIKKAEYQRTDAFELWCWRRLLRVPWTARRSNQFFVKEISPEYSLEGLMLKLKLQYLVTWCKELTHLKRPRCWERWKEGEEGDDRGWDGWMSSSIRWTWVWVNSRSWWWTGKPGMLPSMGLQRVRHDWVIELNWTDQIASLKFKSLHIFTNGVWMYPFHIFLSSVGDVALKQYQFDELKWYFAILLFSFSCCLVIWPSFSLFGGHLDWLCLLLTASAHSSVGLCPSWQFASVFGVYSY